MITSKDILRRTGLKNAKTLTRWYKSGIIPEPLVRTHPSGRGKISYWPDWVGERCERLVELQKRGASLQEALMSLSVDGIRQLDAEVTSRSPLLKKLEETKVRIKGAEREVTVGELFLHSALHDLRALGLDAPSRQMLTRQFLTTDAAPLALEYVANGFNPVMVFDGSTIEIVADFMVAHRLADLRPGATGLVVLSLVPAMRRVFDALKITLPLEPRTWPEEPRTN